MRCLDAGHVPMATNSRDTLAGYLTALNTIEPREYQQSIAKLASKHNTLVILPTALGKTVIAVQTAIHRLSRYPWGKVVVLAPTRPLVHQHVDSFSRFLDYEGAGRPFFSKCELNGHLPKQKRFAMFSSSNLIFATPQTLNNDVQSGLYNLADCVLLVLDECHKTGERYAYNGIVNRFMLDNLDPVILGLTASPGRTTEQVMELCTRLCIERVTSRTADDPDVSPYIHPIDIEVEPCELPLEYHELDIALKDLLDARLRLIADRGFLREKPLGHVNKMDLLKLGRVLWSIIQHEWSFGGPLEDEVGSENDPLAPGKDATTDRSGFFFWLLTVQSQAMKIMHLAELISTQSLFSAYQFIQKMRASVEKSKKRGGSNYRLLQETAIKRIEIFLKKSIDRGKHHPKTTRLVELVGDILGAGKPESPSPACKKIIVFTQFRDTATGLVEAIRSLNGAGCPPAPRYRPVRFVGQATKAGDPGMKQADQQAILESFRNGEYNVLVATRIAEEGLDIPSVSDIIFYEPVPSEIRHIQRRGRTGRHERGRVAILVATGTLDEIFLRVSQQRVDTMERITSILKEQPLQDIIRVPLAPPEHFDDARVLHPEILEVRQKLLDEAARALQASMASAKSFPAGEGTATDFYGGSCKEDEYFLDDGWSDEYNVRRFCDVLGVHSPGAMQIVTASTGTGPKSSSDWHALLKKMTGTKQPMNRKPRTLKRERKPIPATDGGITLYNKTIKWIYEQLKAIDPGADGQVSLPLEELMDMAKFEELDPEEFDYQLKYGVKKGYWTIVKGTAPGKGHVFMRADL